MLDLQPQMFLTLRPRETPFDTQIILSKEEIKHPLDPDKRYWVVSEQCWQQLWREATVAPGTEQNLLYLHRELR